MTTSPGLPLPSRASRIVSTLCQTGVEFVACLPDVWLRDVINEVEQTPDLQLLRVAREEDAVSLCAGLFLGGRKGVALVQNAGALLAVNTLAALAVLHRTPVIMLVAHRGGSDDNQYYQTYKHEVCGPVLRSAHVLVHEVGTASELDRLPGLMQQAWLARSPMAVLLGRDALVTPVQELSHGS